MSLKQWTRLLVALIATQAILGESQAAGFFAGGARLLKGCENVLRAIRYFPNLEHGMGFESARLRFSAVSEFDLWPLQKYLRAINEGIKEPWTGSVWDLLAHQGSQAAHSQGEMKNLILKISDKNDGEILGMLTVNVHSGAGGPTLGASATLGYSVHPLARRQGVAREALLALRPVLEREYGIKEMQALIFLDNLPSIRLVESLKFQKTTEFKDATPKAWGIWTKRLD